MSVITYKVMGDSTDPVLNVLKELEKAISPNLAPLISGYEETGVEGISLAWEDIIKRITDENQ